MDQKNASISAEIILNLNTLAKEKEVVRRKLEITAAKLAITAEKLAVTAKEKEVVRRKLADTARHLALTAAKLAATAQEKESVRRKLETTAANLAQTAAKLAATAKEKEIVRRKLEVTAAKLAATAAKLVITAEKLALTAEKLAATAKDKEVVRRKLEVTAKEKEITRRKLEVTAREKENVRRKLVVTAKKLKSSYETLEKKVLERTKSLEMARAKEEAILLSIGDGLLATDEKGTIIFINKMAETLLGKKSKAVVGEKFFDVIPLEDEKTTPITKVTHPVHKVLVAGAATAELRSAYYRKGDWRFPLAVMATPVMLGGKTIGAIKVFRDITYEREVDKAKTEFVSLASHQLRTPLSAVNWYAEMLLAGDAGVLNKKQRQYLDEVYRSNQRMVELVNALLDVSSLELGTFVVEPEPTDICKLADNVIKEQTPQIEDKNMQFSFSCGTNVSFMQTDPKLLRMIMQNILSNAVKYTPRGGKIDFSISVSDRKHILLKISDTGYGIPKNQQEKIFTKLFRADNVREKDTDGTGLGLYIVKSVVENSGGTVWFTSPGELGPTGTTFSVTLPLTLPTQVLH